MAKKTMRSLGICIGASTLSVVKAEQRGTGRINTEAILIKPHNGNPRDALLKALDGISFEDHVRVAVTGRKLRQAVDLSSIPESEAVETALWHLNGHDESPDVLVSAGGENFMVYLIGKNGRISGVKTGSKCASGTGEFFVQQLRRMGLSIEEAGRFARDENPYRVSGRCSVFCKSDCTHAANKGIPKERIITGLCEMMAGKILEIIRQIPGGGTVMIVGGLVRNRSVIDYLREKIKNLLIPEEAFYFEALGAAVWALLNETKPVPGRDRIFKGNGSTFTYLPPLRDFHQHVEFKTLERGAAQAGDRCILGVDVGSTTTKAVLLRTADDRILASVYLRTNGNPVKASRACYASLFDQLGELADKLNIIAVGVTGSGRQIAGLHAMTDGVINEIIAHAAGALFFDPAVDTIFEIGGQDAKYTFISSGVPVDYAMNDACSAGTGSFLEEAARETMGVEMEAIASLAFAGQKPPNFNDQCAAFISSDIKNAFQDGLTREDILAGLVYSICMNYNNRVKGNRPSGKRIFMQGGVCYNQAVPAAMASLTGERIVVPPEPGLVGAFGVALALKSRLKMGMAKGKNFSLRALKDRDFEHKKTFICNGGKEKCDRKCEISRIAIEGKTYPFGGACNRWYNIRSRIAVDAERLDLVKKYERLIFQDFPGKQKSPENGGDVAIIGVNKSFFVNTFYPMYHHFFSRLGFRVQLPDRPDPEGADCKGAAFCYPAEIAHGYFLNLLQKKPDYLFLPQLKGMRTDGGCSSGTTCPLSQGEPYYLSTAFKDNAAFADLKKRKRLIMPVLDFSDNDKAPDVFADTAKTLGITGKRARRAFSEAQKVQEAVMEGMEERCRNVLAELEKEPDRHAIVIFGRSYNAYVSEANMGIPHKIASRGYYVIPFSFLPLAGEQPPDEMYWAIGQMILKGAGFVARHPQLFACYISNFSCGPDSFLAEYFRHAMGKKPFLILELDSHVADAGLETRIEAFLDIIKNYRKQEKKEEDSKARCAAPPAYFDFRQNVFIDSRGKSHGLRSQRINILIPSMGTLGNRAIAAVFRSAGIRATALPPADEEILKLGRANTSCKECLPLLLTVGSLLKYLKDCRQKDELLVYFMPTASGPCRFGQYSFFLRYLIAKSGIEDVALFSLQAENSYKDLGVRDFSLRLWSGAVLSDIFQDMYSVILANAADKEKAVRIYGEAWEKILAVLEKSPDIGSLKSALAETARMLQRVQGKMPWSALPKVLLTGEIFVRHDGLSSQFIVEKLAEEGFAAKTAGIMEWIYYTDYCFKKNLAGCRPDLRERPALFFRSLWMEACERAYRSTIARSGIIPYRREDVPLMMRNASALINPKLTGEAVLTIGGAISEVPRHYCGAIAIGPFGCMPNRLSEAILSREMGQGWHLTAARRRGAPQRLMENIRELPFLAIESDGNPFPQIIAAKLEVFLSQAARLHKVMESRSSLF